MIVLGYSTKTCAACRFLVIAILLGVSVSVHSYDVEFDIGSRFGTLQPRALGAFSLNASSISGAFAVGTTADGEVSIDTVGNPGIDAYFRGDASYALGSFISGLRLEATTLRSVETGEEAINLSLSAPFTLNGRDLSLSFAPACGVGFYDDESFNFGARLNVSYLAGDFVLKPGATFSETLFPDGSRTLAIAPSLGFVWYPGIPLSADFSVGWSRSETDSGTVSTSFPVSAIFSAVPLPWLCVSAKLKSEADISGLMSYRVDGELELIKYVPNGRAFHLPIAAYYSWTDGGSANFGVSIMVGFSFGQE
ncbi:MAG: hypothetical protein WCT14_00475 [Treponemataceae bacterium]